MYYYENSGCNIHEGLKNKGIRQNRHGSKLETMNNDYQTIRDGYWTDFLKKPTWIPCVKGASGGGGVAGSCRYRYLRDRSKVLRNLLRWENLKTRECQFLLLIKAFDIQSLKTQHKWCQSLSKFPTRLCCLTENLHSLSHS